ncbi:MAG TPA: ABC transporter permease subunit [Firmicutes bacterium]|jgi:ABC-2 type transport system permease protein|nr:ABC transporter permease subunit [Bacillota bacterium]
MNVFLRELRMYRASTITWTVSLAGTIMLFMSMYPALAREIDDFVQILAGFPEVVLKAFSISLDTIGLLTGYYAYVFTFIMLAGGIQAMSLGLSLLSKESRDKTADFLMTKPITRNEIVTAKLSAALTVLLITNAGYLTAGYAICRLVGTSDVNLKLFFMISITMLFVQLIFMALGLLVSVFARKIKNVLPVSLGTVFAFYIINILSSATDDAKLRYLTPFQYFDPNRIQMTAQYETVFVVLTALFVPAAILASYIIYNKKDIHAL